MRWPWQRKKMMPGSEEAARAGCLCPVGFNNAGKKKPKSGWRIRSACPIHGQLDKDVTQVREVRPEGEPLI